MRNTKSEVTLSGACNICHVASAIHAEAVAALRSVQHAAHLGMQHAILETDATVLANALNSADIDRSAIGSLVHQIRDLVRFELSSCTISSCNRECNNVADCLAKYGANVLALGSEELMSQVPVFVRNLISDDLPTCEN